jgi:EmrB/QacA subfamily drug resistance transporter
MTSTSHARRWLILLAVSLGLFMALLDATIVNIAVPSIMKDLDASIASVSWVLNSYNLALAVLFLSVGRIADRFGQKRLFMLGLGLFTAFSLAAGFAPSIDWLIVFRVGQALGAAAMVPISLTILLGVFPRSQHGLATGLWAALGAVAAALGPSLGGVLTEYGSWQWIFFINVPVGIAALLATWRLVPEHKRAADARIDVGGIALSAVTLSALTLALIQGNEWGWESGRILGLFAAAVVGALAFVVWERRARQPMLDLRLFRIRSFAGANAAFLLMGVAMMGSVFLLVIFMVNVMGFSELRAGIAITPMPITGLLLAPVVGKLVDRWGPRLPAVVGALAFGAGLLAMSSLDASATLSDVAWRAVVLGVGMGFAMPSFMASGMGSVPEEHGGVASGAINTARQLGFVLGVAVLVAVFSHTMTTAVNDAKTEAVRVVENHAGITSGMKTQALAAVNATSADALTGAAGSEATGSGATGAEAAGSRAADLFDAAPEGATPAQEARLEPLKAQIQEAYRREIGGAFRVPFLVAAAAAFLILLPAVYTGRHLGAHSGDHERVRTPLPLGEGSEC